VLLLAGSSTRVIDLKGRRVLPGLIDNHIHIIRGGLNFNMELRWDGVRSLATAMDMLREQVAVTPAPQWVRVVGGFTEHQFD
ncbi:amidohydrolase family protein, partial [Burkholderia sp. SIMBA_057]